MKTLDEPSDNKWSEDRRIVERLRNAVSETRQSIVQTQAVIHEARRLVGLAEKIGRPVIRDDLMPLPSPLGAFLRCGGQALLTRDEAWRIAANITSSRSIANVVDRLEVARAPSRGAANSQGERVARASAHGRVTAGDTTSMPCLNQVRHFEGGA
jgi:hypothetical protein